MSSSLLFNAALSLLALSSAACAQENSPSPGAIDPRAHAAVARSRTTGATYSLYAWNWARYPDGTPHQGWSAEFHQGRSHRVETPDIRVVADCAAGTGTMLNVRSGERTSGARVANAACGVNANAAVLAAEWLGRRNGRFGSVDMIKLIDEGEERSYAIDEQGVLMATEIFPRGADPGYCVQNEASAVERTVPAGDLFSPESLNRSVVADRFRAPPPRPAGNFWLRDFSCR